MSRHLLRPRPRQALVRLLLGLSLLAPLAAPYAAQASDKVSGQVSGQVDIQRNRLDDLRRHIETLSRKMSAATDSRDELSRALRGSEREIGSLTQRLREIDDALSGHAQRLAELRADEDRLQAELTTQRQVLRQQVRAAYAMGRQERLKILLNQQDPAVVSRALVYFDYLSRARAAKMAAMRSRLDALDTTVKAIAAEERQLSSLRRTRLGELAVLEHARQQRLDLLAQLNAELAGQGRRLQRLKDDENQLMGLVDDLEQALANIPIPEDDRLRFNSRRGSLPWPTSGRLGSRFGAPRLGSLVWDGVMISAPEGEAVRAVHHGRVAYADWLRGFGLLLIVDHGDGYMTLYGHNQSLFKEPGDWVEADETIALVGSSGGREQSGVYFGIRYQGRAVDPARWCRKTNRGNVG